MMGHGGGVDEEFVEAWRSALGEMIYLPSQQRYGRIASATNSDKVESLQVRPFFKNRFIFETNREFINVQLRLHQ